MKQNQLTKNQNRISWLPFAIAAAFIAVAGFAIVSYLNTRVIRETEQQVARSYAIREATNQLLSAMKDAATGQRGFLLTGDETFLNPYHNGVEKFEHHLAELHRLAIGDDETERHVLGLQESFEQQQAHFKETIQLRRSQPASRVSDDVLAMVKTGRGEAAMNMAREAADQIVSNQLETLKENEAANSYLSHLSETTISAGNFIALALILATAVAAFADRRKRDIAELALVTELDRQREYAAVLEQISDAVLVCDMDGCVRSCNDSAEAVLGASETELVGKRARDLLSVDPEQWETDRGQMFQTGLAISERRWVSPDGEELILEQRRSLIQDASGTPIGKLLFLIDITDRVRQEAKERRNQRIESLGTLTGGIAHDLNNVLTPIVMSAKLLQRGSKTPERLIENIITSADRGGRMIKKLLAFAGGGDGERKQMDLRDLLSELEEILSHTLQQSIDLQVSIPEKLREVNADSTDLAQVVMNLAINARDAMPSGGRLEIAVENFDIDDSRAERSEYLTPGPHVMLTVADNGQGIPREIIDRIFDPFFTTKDQDKGTGLGLASALGIVRSYGGDIIVYSEPGVGTKFSVCLPSSKLSAEIAENDEQETVPVGRGETVLIVDDERLILETAQETLESNQYKVMVAGSGTEGVAIYQNRGEQIDLVLLDMMMPGIDGLETKDAIRSIHPSAKVIASSGLRRPGHEGGRMNGFDGFLPKPYTDERLLRLVREVLDHSDS